MDVEKAPLSEWLFARRIKKVRDRFGVEHLFLHKYLAGTPERFFSAKAVVQVFGYLSQALEQSPQVLEQCLAEYGGELARGLRCLDDINRLGFHDDPFPYESFECASWIDTEVMPVFNRLVEGSFCKLLLPLAVISRTERGAQLEGLDTYNVVEELKKLEQLRGLVELYDHVIRNAVAHGNVEYHHGDIVFRDKREVRTVDAREFVEIADRMVDTCNAAALAWTLFLAQGPCDGRHAATLRLPLPLRFEELRATASTIDWTVLSYLEYESFERKKQLNVAVQNDWGERWVTLLHAVTTAAIAERLAPGYDRYFLHLRCSKSQSKTGWMAFDGQALRDARKRRENGEDVPIEVYGQAIPDGGLFFWPRAALIRMPVKVAWMKRTMQAILPEVISDFFLNLRGFECSFRDLSIHRAGRRSVVRGRVVLTPKDPTDMRS